ncbi:MAG: tetratricopeptide repeat protein [Lachnospiraceae bacterium]|nr:tetratricopeptide repeat protein [Lachnospiraceae bacterium]
MEINLIFHILGLTKTKNEDSIRNAYRQALKNNNPEDNPEGFKELRTAYEEALAYARTSEEEKPESISTSASPEVNDWLKKVNTLYQDLPSRRDLSKWKPLMEDELCQSIDTSEEVREQFLNFLLDHFRFPQEVWQYFDKTFYFLNDMDKLSEKFPTDFLNYMKFYMKHDSFPSFEFFSYRNLKDETCEGDAYIDHYLLIKQKVDKEDTKECYHLLDQLSSFGVYHPYEDVEKSRLLLLAGKKEEALSLISPIFDKYPNDNYIQLYTGVCKYENGYKEDAVNLWKHIAEEYPKNYYAQFYLSKYYMDEEMYYDAKDSLIILLEIDGDNPEIQASLTKVNDALITVLTKDMETGNENDHFSALEIPLEIGWCLFQNHRNDEAISLLQNYEPSKDTEYNYYNLYGRLLYQIKHYKDALPLLEKWYSIIYSLKDDGTEETRKRMSRLGMASYILSECYSELNRLKEAEDILHSAISKSDGLMESLEYENHLADIYLKHQHYEKAIDLCDTIISKDTSYYPAYVIRQECFYHLDKGQEVVDDYHRAIDIFPGYYKPYMFACEVFSFHGQYEDAQEVLDLAKKNQITLTPRMQLYQAKILRNLAKSKEDVLAIFPIIKHLQKEVIKPDCDIEDISEISYEMGLLYWDTDQLQKAYNFVSKASKENPKRLQYQMVLGDILVQMKKYPQALETYEKGKEEYEHLAVYHYNIGICYESLAYGETDLISLAIRSYRTALDIDEYYRDCNEKLADIYNNLYHNDEDIKYLELAITYATKEIESNDCCYYRVNRGLIYMNSMDAKYIEMAIHDFEAAIEFISDDWAAWNNLGCCYKYLGDFNHAIECLQKAAEYMQENKTPLPYGNMADCYEAMFDFEKAISCYKRNLELFPDDLSPWEEIGDLYSYMGNTDKAIRAYQNTQNLELIKEKGILHSIKREKISSFFSAIPSYIQKAKKEDMAKHYHFIGDIFYDEMANYKKALTYYQKALKYPLDSYTRFKYEKDCAFAFYMMKRFDEAKDHAELSLKALQKIYDNEEDYYNYTPYSPVRLSIIGQLYMILGDADKALLLFSRMNSGLRCKGCRYPGCYEYQLYLGHFYNIKGEKDNALLHYKKAIELNPHCDMAKIELEKFNK